MLDNTGSAHGLAHNITYAHGHAQVLASVCSARQFCSTMGASESPGGERLTRPFVGVHTQDELAVKKTELAAAAAAAHMLLAEISASTAAAEKDKHKVAVIVEAVTKKVASKLLLVRDGSLLQPPQ